MGNFNEIFLGNRENFRGCLDSVFFNGRDVLSQAKVSIPNIKVNSVQEACAKCFAVHILRFEILQIAWNKWNKQHQTLIFQFFTNRFNILRCVFFCFQIFLKSEAKSIWHKLLVLSWLYLASPLLCSRFEFQFESKLELWKNLSFFRQKGDKWFRNNRNNFRGCLDSIFLMAEMCFFKPK